MDSTYLMIRSAVSQEVCQLLTDYALLKSKCQYHTRKNDLLANVHREYADPLMELFLERLKPTVEKATGLELWPTLSFYYTYSKNQQLMKHKDRPSCEIVAGLCLGADQTFQEKQITWPLMIDDQGKETAIHLSPGDLVIFKGYETTHWREPFEGDWFVSAIFAYVDKNGPLSFLKYDQRQHLGDKHIGMFNWSFGFIKNYLRRK